MRMIQGSTSGKRSIHSTSRHTAQLLRTVGPGQGPHVLLVSHAGQAVCAHAERCREHPRSGSRERWSETNFADFLRALSDFFGIQAMRFRDPHIVNQISVVGNLFLTPGSRDIHTSGPWDRSGVKGLMKSAGTFVPQFHSKF